MGVGYGKIEAGYTGQNTKQGDILNIRFENERNQSAEHGTRMHVVLHSDNILMIKANDIEVEN